MASVLFSLLLSPAIVFGMVDTDNDGLVDEHELIYYTDPTNPDTDGDGHMDGEEVRLGYSPHANSSTRMHEHDYDGDGLNDWLERWFGSDIGKKDSDGDGYTDFDEVMFGYSPASKSPFQQFHRNIVVDRTQQRLYYYVDGVKLMNAPVSTGNPGSETPEGAYTVERLVAMKDYVGPGYHMKDVAWNIQFLPMYYIHSAYWHNDFGVRTHSHGCVNMRYNDAEMLYKYMGEGIPVTVTGTTPSKYVVGS